jgi:peptide/nickel transport system permease protein
MLEYTLRRILYMMPTLLAISIITFIVIQLPPGDFLTSYIATLQNQGQEVDQAELAALTRRYGLDQPLYVQYIKWLAGVVQGDFGVSFEWNRPVGKLIWGRLALTFVLSFSALIVQWLIAFPIGIYGAVRQYSMGDYMFTGLAFISASIPHFLLALVFMWVVFTNFGINITGLFSPEFAQAPWSPAKLVDLLKHLWAALLILGVFGGAGLIRTMRANLLDELHKPYVITARAKGLTENKLTLKYPVRVALNPFVSTVGWTLPQLISGTTITSIVLGLPTTGPLLLRALQSQDMYLAGSFLIILSALTVLGTFLSDMMLGWLDPRIRYM